MNTLMKLCKLNNDIIGLVKRNILPFVSFKQVFIFGSVLETNEINNDIDILIIYEKISNEFIKNLISFSNKLEAESCILVDITVLSTEEEKEIQFLERIKPKYLKLK